MSSTAMLMWGMIFGSIGCGYCLYGKKQQALVPLIIGIALCLVPYFIANAYVLIGVGVILVTIPYFTHL